MSTENLDDQVKTVTAAGQPVKERISSILAARNLYKQLKESDHSDSIRRARLKGQIDGNPPYNSTRLKELGLGHRTNINFLECRAILDLKAAAHYELFFEVPTLVEARITPGLMKPEEATQYGAIIAEEFTKTLMKWSGFLVNMDLVRREADAYGLGVAIWRDEWDWRPKAFRRGNFLVEPDAGLDLEELNFFALRDKVTAGDLYRWAIEEEETAKAEGWKPSVVKRILAKIYIKGEAGNNTDNFQTSDWESIQQRIRNNDWFIQSQEFKQVKIIHVCVKEVDNGEVSHYIMLENANDVKDEFLFRKTRRFRSMSQVLWWLPYNNGDVYIKSCRGLASMIESHCDLSNRFMGQVFDAGFMVGSLILQPKTAMDLSQLQLIRMGPITVLPPEVNAIQTTFAPRITELVQLRDLSSSIMKNNTGVFRQNSELFAERQPQKTARQVVEEVAKEARIEKANIAYDYEHVERLYREMFRRITDRDYLSSEIEKPGQKEARAFVARCLVRGVPPQLFETPDIWEIFATRAIGMGSWGVKMDITNQLLQARPLFDTAGQNQAVRDWLAVRVGYQNVDKYKPQQNRDLIPDNERTIAVLETNDMKEGDSVPVGADQNHVIHYMVHAETVFGIVQAVEKTQGRGLDVGRLALAMSVLIPHIQETLQHLAQDPAQKKHVEAGKQLLAQAQQTMSLLERLAKQQAQQAQAQAQADGAAQEAQLSKQDQDLQLKAQKMAAELRMEAAKQASINEMRSSRTDEQMDIRREQSRAELALKGEKQAGELAMEAAKTQAEIDLDRAREAG